MSNLLDSLNAEQRAAAEHVDGPLLILAGPGSGKTRVVTYRIAHLLELGVLPRQILALTFTNKAAEEMRNRLVKLGADPSVWVGTFHRFCSRLLRQHASFAGLKENYSILDIDDSRKLLGAAVAEARVEDAMVSVDKLGQAISWAKNQLIDPAHYPQAGTGVWKAIVERVYPLYQRRLLAANCVDFDDLLMHVALMLRDQPDLRRSLDNRYRQIMVDEYQDTNLAQYAIVRALSVDHPNLAVVGDPDQSIYGWRGANLSNILEFEHDYPRVKVVKLERNYRSTPNILETADALIRNNSRRKAKVLVTERAEGAPVQLVCCPSANDEADLVARRIAAEIRAKRRRPRDFAIAYRMNALSRQFELALHQHRVPYQVVQGLEFFQRKEVKDLLAYLHLVNNPANDAAVLRIINTPVRGIGKSTVHKLADHAAANRLTLMEAARRGGSSLGLAARASVSISRFVTLVDRLRKSATASVEQLLAEVIEATGYRSELERSSDPEDAERVANVDELVTAAREFDMANPGPAPLEAFLEQTSLVADTDALEAEQDKVTLMTLHAAKGLEFPVVFLVAMEQGILPHERSAQDDAQLEEERRLLFVGITRAEDELHLSFSQYRMTRGLSRPAIPSSFLMELPRSSMQIHGSLFSDEYAEESRWGRKGGDDHDDAWDDDSSYFQDTANDGDADADAHSIGDTDDANDRNDRNDMRDANHADPAEGVDDLGEAVDTDATGGGRWGKRRRVEPEAPRPASVVTTRLPGGLKSAAELAQDVNAGERPFAPDLYRQGMRVRHPEYGIGTVVALSRSGLRRQGTVVFERDGQERRFVLLHSRMRPVDESSAGPHGVAD
jgi:DNA helicase-2/ATP-dependent DNA helicase PcrA